MEKSENFDISSGIHKPRIKNDLAYQEIFIPGYRGKTARGQASYL